MVFNHGCLFKGNYALNTLVVLELKKKKKGMQETENTLSSS